MDARELRPRRDACLQNFPKSPLWIIEYVWAHKMMEIQEVVDASNWPEVDSQPLTLEDSWRLRVASAQVYSIVRNRDVKHYDRVMGFLEATHRLLPSLVASIKHMKIMFGLKTLVIMKMLREGRGMVDTVLKISHFFPNKLPQYQGQCSQSEMFLMRKNHLDFKTLAQGLAMSKDQLERYVENQMEEQYGEHYAQKVEDRLLHYLQELEAALPGDTYIDQILKKESPVTEEEKLLMEVITSDSASIATTLKKLLHCDAASCRPGSSSSQSALRRRSSEALTAAGAKTLLQVVRGGQEAHQQEDGEEDGSPGQEASASPQFCSKHQRWVRSILQQCPDECSEEADVSSSPLLFLSSSPDAPSTEDLTPSDIVPCPPDQQRPPSQTSTHLLTAVQASEGDRRSGSAELLLSSRDTNVSPRLSPGVQLLDFASVIFKPCQVLLRRLPVSVLGPEVLSSPHRNTRPPGTRRDSATDPPDAVATTTTTTTTTTTPTTTTPAPNGPLFKVQAAVRAETSRGRSVLPKSPPASPAVLLQPCERLQPRVRLQRLSVQQCCAGTKPRTATTDVGSKGDVQEDRREEEEEEKDGDSSFDVNTLYSGDSSSDSEDSFHGDPEYKPRFKKKRLLSQQQLV